MATFSPQRPAPEAPGSLKPYKNDVGDAKGEIGDEALSESSRLDAPEMTVEPDIQRNGEAVEGSEILSSRATAGSSKTSQDNLLASYSPRRPAPKAPGSLNPYRDDIGDAKRKISDKALSKSTQLNAPGMIVEPDIQQKGDPMERNGRLNSQAAAGSSRTSEQERQVNLRPQIPSLSSSISRNDLDIVFGSLPLRPELKPICDMRKGRKCAHKPKDELDESPLYICLDCGEKPICEACIREVLANPAHPHQADHYLYAWRVKSSFQFNKFLWQRRYGPSLHLGSEEEFGRAWLYSDRSFAPSSIGNLTVRFVLNAERGIYHASVTVRTFVNPASTSKEALGKKKVALIKAGCIGSLGVGMQAVNRQPSASREGINPSLQRLPEKIVEHEIERNTEKGTVKEKVISPAGTVQVLEDQAVEISIRHWYEKCIFKGESPFKWWLESIT